MQQIVLHLIWGWQSLDSKSGCPATTNFPTNIQGYVYCHCTMRL